MQDDNENPVVPVASAGMTFGGDKSIPPQYFANVGAGNPGDSPVGMDFSTFKGQPRHPVHKLADMGALHLITQVLLGRDTQEALNDYKASLQSRKR